ISRWSWGLIRDAGAVLLDRVPGDEDLEAEIREALAGNAGDRITDLHVWQIGPGHCAAIVAIASPQPRQPSDYKARLGHIHELSHVTVEVEVAAPA
ncbi:MAG: cation transporter, partial [Tropicimonas sp.]